MWKNTRGRINFFRKRHISWQNLKNQNVLVGIFIAISVISVLALSTTIFKNRNSNEVLSLVSTNSNESKTNLQDISNNEDKNNNNSKLNESIKSNEDLIENEKNETKTNTNTKVDSKSGLKLTILGEIMMGGQVNTNLNYVYTSAFKDIYNHTKASDITHSTLATPITSLDTVSNDVKSKYIVTKQILNAFNSLGIDTLSFSTDHMLDFGNDVLKNTISLVKENDIYISGLKDSTVFIEKNNKKIAIISTTDVILGTKSNFNSAGINVYEANKLKLEIANAKENADMVIVDIHWGREYVYGVTEQMKQIAKFVVDSGANLVTGSHAMGTYPIITYKDVPIIYSTGYLMTDSDLNLDKEGFIYDININNDLKIESIELIPTYVTDKKQVKYYYNYDKAKSDTYLMQMNNWQLQNGLNSKVINNLIKIEF